jgi:hypothetical protein
MSVPKSATSLPGEGSSCPFVGPPGGGLPPPEAAAFALADALLGPGAATFADGTGLLLLEAAAFVLPRTLFASRIGSAILTMAQRFYAASLRSLFITADTTTSIFRP